MRITDSDILVIGAGPAGCAAAIALARRGLRVVVLDKARFPREKLCGEFMSPEGVAALERLGVLPAVREAGAEPVTGTLVSAPSGRCLAAAFDGLGPLFSQGLALRRRALDAILVEAARRAGAEVLEGVTVEGPIIEENTSTSLGAGRVVGALARRSPGAPPEAFRARWVLAADGRQTRFASSATTVGARGPSHPCGSDLRSRSLATVGAWRPLPHCAFKAHFHGVPPIANRVEIHAFPGGYAGLVRVDGGITNCCFLIDAEAVRQARGDADALTRCHLFPNPLLRRRLAGAERVGEWVATGPLDYAVREPVAEGVLLLGDAAGIIDPFCGDGMAMALRSAEMAVKRLLNGRLHIRSLRSLSARRAARSPVDSQRGSEGLELCSTEFDDAVGSDYRERWSREFARRLRVARALRKVLLTPALAELAIAGLRPFPAGVRVLVRATRS